jgi:hypothetical protein
MLGLRLLTACLSVLILAAGAQARPNGVQAPRSLHGFLLRADEPMERSFARTPAFAWAPVAGARRYQFQLATSSTFRENAILYSASNLTTPVVAPQLTLPWIDDMLHARVRAILPRTTTPWSTQFAFDMDPPSAPTSLPSYSGILRWTPVEGADGYQVWLVDIPRLKIETTYTNVLDEREFYTFHRSPAWISTVHWRVRALRRNIGPRQNGLPAVSYGPWSDVYRSSNDAYQGGPLQLVAAISDTVSRANSTEVPDHRLMPGFVFKGDQTSDGRSAELFRIYVFTDHGCLNRVFTSAIIGGSAYAPRSGGPLDLPRDEGAAASARKTYLFDGTEPTSYTLDGSEVQANESLPATSPTTTIPTDSDADPAATPPATAGTSPGSPTNSQAQTSTGVPPVDLWDTEPSGGYWWTVVAVEALPPGHYSTTVMGAGAGLLDTTIQISDAAPLAPGDVLTIGDAPDADTVTVRAVNGHTITFSPSLLNNHLGGEPVVRSGGEFRYRDLELPQDVCAPSALYPQGRVARVAKSSEPSLTAAGEAFASGLSSTGKLVAAARSSAFYGNPLVSWTPALGAAVYEVQWSKTRQPFKPQPNPAQSGAPGMLVWSTSAVLPLGPGTWYYRVRGFNYSLPTGAQQMSWSDPSKIVVAKPKFRVVGGGK